MENIQNPIEEGFAPAAEEKIPQANESAKTLEKKKAAGKAYMIVCLAFLAIYFIIAAVSSVVALIPTGIEAGKMIFSDEMTLTMDYQSTEEFTEQYIAVYKEIMQNVSPKLQMWSTIGTGIGIIVGLLVAGQIVKKIKVPKIEKRKLSAGEYFFLLIIALGLWGAGAIFSNLPTLLGLRNALDSIMGGTGKTAIVFIVYAIIGAPVLEELLCRKFLLDKLAPFGEVPAAFMSALLFGLFHGNSTQFIYAFCVGLVLAVVYLKSGNILYSMSFHFILNSIASIADIAAICGASDEVVKYLGIGFYVLLAVFAVVGITIAIVKRKNPLLKLSRPDYPDCNRIMFKNPGFIVYMIMIAISTVSIDGLSLGINLLAGNGAKSLLCLVPTVFFFIFVFSLMKTVGKHSEIPEENVHEPEQTLV